MCLQDIQILTGIYQKVQIEAHLSLSQILHVSLSADFYCKGFNSPNGSTKHQPILFLAKLEESLFQISN